MFNSKVIEALQLITGKQRTRLRRFVHSPFHNKHTAVIKLFDHLDKLPQLTIENTNREKLFSKVFPGEKFNDLKFRHTLNYLYSIIEDYLSVSRLESQPIEKRLMLLEELSLRSDDHLFQSSRVKAQKLLEKHQFRDAAHHLARYRLMAIETQHSLSSSRNDEARTNLLQMSEDLDLFYLAEKLRLAYNLLSFRKLYKDQVIPEIPQAMLDRISKEKLYEIPAIGVYYRLYQLEMTGQHEHFDILVGQIKEKGALFPEGELKEFYEVAINYCIRRLNRSISGAMEKAFELYQAGITSGALIEKGQLSPFAYQNVALIAIRLGKVDWASQFLEEYRPIVKAKMRETVYLYARANVDYHKKEFKACIKGLNQISTDDPLIILATRSVIIKSWYELDDQQAVEYAIVNLDKLLKRRKLLTYHRENYENFIWLVQRLPNILDSQAAKTLETDINEAEILTERKWLLEKLAEKKVTI